MPLQSDLRQSIPTVAPLNEVSESYPTDLEYSELEFSPTQRLNDPDSEVGVYRASVRGENLTVALKQPPQGRGKTIDKKAFARLMDATVRGDRLDDHPYIVDTIDWGTEPVPWVVTEFLQGGTLEEYVSETSVDQRMWTAFAIADAFATVHRTGYAHFDISPSNIVFKETRKGFWNVPKVIDWDTSRDTRDSDSHIGADESIDHVTPAYQSPEMSKGVGSGYSILQSDVFQLGVVCYELLTGRHPETTDFTAPSQVAELPRQIDSVLKDSYARNPNDRYQSAESLRHELKEVISETITTSQSQTRGGPLSGQQPSSTATSDSRPSSTPRSRAQNNYSNTTAENLRPSSADSEGGHREHRSPDQPNDSHRPPTVEDQKSVDRSGASTQPTEDVGDSSPGRDTELEVIRDDAVWSMYRAGPRRRGYCQQGSLTQQPKRKWCFEGEGWIDAPPVVAGGAIIFGCEDSGVYALDQSTGNELWSYQTDGRVVSTPAATLGDVYVGSRDQNVYCLAAGSGRLSWKYKTDFWVESSPLVLSDRVYVGSNDGSLYELRAGDGRRRWQFDTNDPIGTCAPATDGRVVLVGSDNGNVYAVNIESGQERWRFESDFNIRTTPAITDTHAFLGGPKNRVHAIDINSGETGWTFEADSDVQTSPAVTADTVFVGSHDRHVYALNATDGSVNWKFETEEPVRFSPSVTENTVYVASADDSLYALNTDTGTLRWRFDLEGQVSSAPVVTADSIYLGCGEQLIALEPPA
jgi:outer membrane protein assembly factor BamB/serine/threonine protein kinase